MSCLLSNLDFEKYSMDEGFEHYDFVQQANCFKYLFVST